MKKLFALSVLSLMAANSAFAIPGGGNYQQEAVLDLTGKVSELMAIDIDSPTGIGSGCVAGGHECNSDLGDLRAPLADLIVAKIGVLSNNGYQIFMYSDNGGMKGTDPQNSAYLDTYKLGWEDVALAQQVGQGVAAKSAMLPTAVALGSYECSLVTSCPGTATARHEIHLQKDANPGLGAGKYGDKVHFVIENASGI